MTATLFQQQQGGTSVVPQPPSGPRLSPGDHGCDIASYQRTVNWKKYAASGQKFIWIKATEGTNYANPYFGDAWAGSKSVGLQRGSYHFARPNLNSPEAEVAWFLQHAQPLQDDDLLALDMEDGSGNLFDWTLRFLNALAARAGRKAYFYSGLWFMQPHNLCHTEIDAASAGLWYASYQSTLPPTPAGWQRITFWQYTSSSTVPGVSGGVDQSIYLG